MIDRFNVDELNLLRQQNGATCISCYMATNPAGRDGKQDAIALKNLVREAESALDDLGVSASDARVLLRPMGDLPADLAFWSDRALGLAAFAAPGFFKAYRCPQPFTSAMFVASAFRTRPLLPLLAQPTFHLLAISENAVSFYRFDEYGIESIAIPDLPGSMQEALNYSSADRGAQVHSAGIQGGRKQSAVFHGQGGEPDAKSSDLGNYCGMIDRAVTSWLGESRIPLVLAAVDRLGVVYRQKNTYHYLLENGISGNQDHRSKSELHQSAWQIGAARRASQDAAIAQRFADRRGIEVAEDSSSIVRAATSGQIAALFYDPQAELFGAVDPAKQSVEITGKSCDTDLIDFAATETLRCGGSIHPIADSGIPTNSPLAAILRY